MKIEMRKTREFTGWLKSQADKSKSQIGKRLLNIEQYGHFGTTRYLGDGLAELKFKNGTRIYFQKLSETEIQLILGGNKNGQDKDIAKAKKFLIP